VLRPQPPSPPRSEPLLPPALVGPRRSPRLRLLRPRARLPGRGPRLAAGGPMRVGSMFPGANRRTRCEASARPARAVPSSASGGGARLSLPVNTLPVAGLRVAHGLVDRSQRRRGRGRRARTTRTRRGRSRRPGTVGHLDPDGPVGPLDRIGQLDARDRQADGQQEGRGGGHEDRPPRSPSVWRSTGDGFAARARRRDDRAQVSCRRGLIDRPHVGTEYRIGEIRVELWLIARRHAESDRSIRSVARAGPWQRQ
jgi:hypothetical protein